MPVSFTRACMDFFGRLPGQSISEFAAELKELSEQDRRDLIGYFKEIGIEIAAR